MRKQIAIILITAAFAVILAGCSVSINPHTENPEPDALPSSADTNKESEMDKEITDPIKVGYVNEISTADVWIIADIEENHKTSIWGTAALKGAEPKKEYSAKIEKSADDRYLLRMIDEDELYYESGSFTLLEGYSLLVREGPDFSEPHIIIYDDTGNEVEDLAVFRAAL